MSDDRQKREVALQAGLFSDAEKTRRPEGRRGPLKAHVKHLAPLCRLEYA